MYIERKVESKIKKYVDSTEIIAIIGPRQSGKTTLARKIFDNLENSLFISFEDISLRALFDEDPDAFYKLYIIPYITNTFVSMNSNIQRPGGSA